MKVITQEANGVPLDQRPVGRKVGGRPVGRSRLLDGLASWPLWIVSLLLFVTAAGVFFGSSAPFAVPQVETLCGQAPLDMRLMPRAAEVQEFLTACGPDGRAAYRNMQLADLAYPALFGLFMASSLAMVATRLWPGRPRAVALPALALVATGFDYLENLAVWLALWAFPDPAATDSLLGVASAAKTITSWLVVMLLVVGAAALGLRRLWALWAPRAAAGVG